jgi:hypothetical protein
MVAGQDGLARVTNGVEWSKRELREAIGVVVVRVRWGRDLG